jgi:hypothetical protein
MSKDNPAIKKSVLQIRVVPDGSVFMAATEPFKHFLTKKLFRSQEEDLKLVENGVARENCNGQQGQGTSKTTNLIQHPSID